MKKKFSILLISFFIGSVQILSAQAPAIQWQKSFGGSDYDDSWLVQQTSDGGYIIVGTTRSNNGDVTGLHGQGDVWIVKTDASGNIIWQKTYGGTAFDGAVSAQQTSDGGYIIAGSTTSNNGDVSGQPGFGWVLKITATGDLTWQKTFGTTTTTDGIWSIQQTSDGGYILASNIVRINANSHQHRDFLLIKLDHTGNLSWQKSMGGSSSETPFSVKQTADGGYIMAGVTSSNDGDVTGWNGSVDGWVVKTDASGNIIWQNALGGQSADLLRSVQQTADGGYIVAGWTTSNNGDVSGNHGLEDFWVVKLTASGTIAWQKTLGGSQQDYGYSIHQTTDGGYIVAGLTYSNDGDVTGYHGRQDAWVVKLDGAGNLIWQKALGGSDEDFAYSIQQTADGGYILTGPSDSRDGDVTGNHGEQDFWVVKLAPEVIIQPEVPEVPCKDDGPKGKGSNQKVNVCHKGKTISVSPCALKAHLAHGDYAGSCVVTNRKTLGSEERPGIGLSIYPNTSSGNFVADLNYSHVDEIKDAFIQVINTSGQVIKQLKVNKEHKLNFSLNESGVYFIRLVSGKQVITKKSNCYSLKISWIRSV